MTADDLHDVLDKIPADDLTKVVLCLKYGSALTIDSIARKEADYLVFRGRENGTSDEGRAFFVPYEDILFIKLDKPVRIEELKMLYGEKVVMKASVLDAPPPSDSTAATPAPTTNMDPAAIAKQNLLARIRAARSAAGST